MGVRPSRIARAAAGKEFSTRGSEADLRRFLTERYAARVIFKRQPDTIVLMLFVSSKPAIWSEL